MKEQVKYTALVKKINNLTYHFKDSDTAPIHFINSRGLMDIYNEIKNGNISIGKIEED